MKNNRSLVVSYYADPSQEAHSGQTLNAYDVLRQTRDQHSSSELLKCRDVRKQKAGRVSKTEPSLGDLHDIYYYPLSVMSPFFHVIIYRTAADRKTEDGYEPAKFGLFDSEKMIYKEMTIDQLITWLLARSGNKDALERVVRDAYDALRRQETIPRNFN